MAEEVPQGVSSERHLVNFLQRKTVKDLIQDKKREIVEIESNTSINEALRIMRMNGILSVPVWDKDSGSYLGFLDVLDILVFLLQMYSEDQVNVVDLQWSNWVKDAETLTQRGIRFGIRSVKHFIDASRKDKFYPVNDIGTVFQLIEGMFYKGIHRVPVLNDLKKVVNIVSQSDVIKLLDKNIAEAKEFQYKTIEELGMGSNNVIAMSSKAQVIHAFYLMFYHKVSAVAVVDNDKLVGQLSASDVRGLDPQQFPEYTQSCEHFFKIHNRFKMPITCTGSSTIGSVIHKLAVNRIHRVWVIDEEGKPTGVVSTSDIMKLLATFPLQ